MAVMSDFELGKLIVKYFKPADWANVYRIIIRESGGDPTQHNDNVPVRERSYGLMQINTNPDAHGKNVTREQMLDPDQNLKYAASLIYGSSGWAPWNTPIADGITGTPLDPNWNLRDFPTPFSDAGFVKSLTDVVAPLGDTADNPITVGGLNVGNIVKGAAGTITLPAVAGMGLDGIKEAIVAAASALAQAPAVITQPIKDASAYADAWAQWLNQPNLKTRLVAGLGGAFLLIVGIVLVGVALVQSPAGQAAVKAV